jgi:hypothetical protein
VTLKLWQILVLTALPALLGGVLIGRYAVPHNGPETDFYRHLNDAFEARRGDVDAQRRIAERYRTTVATDDASEVQANVRAAIPALEAYNADHGGYTGASLGTLRASYDAGIEDATVVRADRLTYCVESVSGSTAYHKDGPASDIVAGRCP